MGDRTDYLGKTSSGDWIPWPRWADPIDTYYYGTDMPLNELAQYLGAEIIDDRGGDEVAHPTLKVGHETLEIVFYWSRTSQYGTPPEQFRSTPKKYIFEVSDFKYKVLVKSFR